MPFLAETSTRRAWNTMSCTNIIRTAAGLTNIMTTGATIADPGYHGNHALHADSRHAAMVNRALAQKARRA